jgi:hypothetical protein
LAYQLLFWDRDVVLDWVLDPASLEPGLRQVGQA